MVKLAQALGWERFVVAGHSMGGAIALTTAIYHADRLNGLLLIDTGARLRVHPDILQAAQLAADTGRRLPMRRDLRRLDMRRQLRLLSRLKDIHLPALAVCGEEDRPRR